MRGSSLVTLEVGLRKMASGPADQAGLTHGGRIASGKKADLVLFDAARIDSAVSPDRLEVRPLGISGVWAKGMAVLADAVSTGNRSGIAGL